MRVSLSSLALLSALALPLAAHADNFTFSANGSGGGVIGSGTLVTTSNGNNSYTITNITGPGITSFFAPGQFNGNDNLLFPSATPVVDGSGFAFADVMGNTAFNVDIFSTSNAAISTTGYAAYINDSDGNKFTTPVSLNLSPTVVTPEPSSLILLGTGALGLLGAARRRFMKA